MNVRNACSAILTGDVTVLWRGDASAELVPLFLAPPGSRSCTILHHPLQLLSAYVRTRDSDRACIRNNKCLPAVQHLCSGASSQHLLPQTQAALKRLVAPAGKSIKLICGSRVGAGAVVNCTYTVAGERFERSS
jgi:hypothetical protein